MLNSCKTINKNIIKQKTGSCILYAYKLHIFCIHPSPYYTNRQPVKNNKILDFHYFKE